MIQSADEAKDIAKALKERFAQYGLELNTEKNRVISFGRYEEENARRLNRKANTFGFLGFTHYCGQSRKGCFLLGRRTSGKKFQNKCREMNAWLKAVRNICKVKEMPNKRMHRTRYCAPVMRGVGPYKNDDKRSEIRNCRGGAIRPTMATAVHCWVD